MAARPTVTHRPYPSRPRLVGPLEELRSEVGPDVAGLLDVFEAASPGIVARILANGEGPTLIRACAPLIISSDLQQQHRYSPFVSSIIEAIDPALDLFAVTLTSPQGRDDRATTMAAGRAVLARVAAGGGGAGGWLARDRRAAAGEGDHHLHGLIATEREHRRETISREWLSCTGGSALGISLTTVRGYPSFQRGDGSRVLRANLHNVIAYALKPLPGDELRDLADDVVASGALAGPWSAFRRVEATMGAPATLSRVHRKARRDTPPTCVICGKSLDAGPRPKRVDASTCGATCRKAKARKEAKAKADAVKKGSTR